KTAKETPTGAPNRPGTAAKGFDLANMSDAERVEELRRRKAAAEMRANAIFTKAAPPPKGKIKGYRVLGDCEETTTCVACGQPGEVKRIKPVGRPGVQAETLHEVCAEGWFAKA